MIRGAHARRFLVVGLIGAGWLSILGNSPGPTYKLKVVSRSGDIQIVVPAEAHNICLMYPSAPRPVRRFTSFNGTEMIAEVICEDGSDCLRGLPNPNAPCYAIANAATPPDGGNYAAGMEGSTDAGGGSSALWSCPTATGGTVALRASRGPKYNDYDFCSSETATYRVEAETAAGARSGVQIKIEEEPPPGYFGCN